jgi:hypothetical protein
MGVDAAEASDALRAKMNDGASPLAAIAALSLDQIDSSEDIGPRLVELLRSPHRLVRITAIRNLADHVEPDDVERALALHYPGEADEGVKQEIARALNKLVPAK